MQSNGLYMTLSNPNYLNTSINEISYYSNNFGSWTVEVSIPLALSAAGNWQSSNVPRNPPLDYQVYPIYDHMAITDIGLANTHIDIQNSFNSGINVTGPNVKGTTITQAQTNMLVNGFGLIPKFGSLASVYGISQNWVALSGVDEYNPSTIGNGTVFENFQLNNTAQPNGYWTALLGEENGGYDIFGSYVSAKAIIPLSDFSSDGSLRISGAIDYSIDLGGNNATGANTSITLSTRPPPTRLQT